MAIRHHRTHWETHLLEGSGKMHERFTFGEVRVNDPGYGPAMNTFIQQYRAKRQPVSFAGSVEVIAKFQPLHPETHKPIDPERPIKQFPSALRQYVLERLGGGSKVYFWTAVGSFVDKDFGADAVFEVVMGGRKHIVPIDVTIYSGDQPYNPHHIENLVVIKGEVPDAGLEPQKFMKKVEDVGKEILGKIPTTAKDLRQVL